MDSRNFKIVEDLYHAALERPADERESFVSRACDGDEELLREVRSLLAYEGEARRFIEEPPAGAATQEARPDPGRSWVGRRLGSYEVLAPLGAGGMGEVYRAKDTKLGREVALKVLPEAFSRDPDRVARFQREARLLAALSHPNIASIHGLEESQGRHVLVLELVPGQTLAGRLARGPIPVTEALPLFRQVAEALDAAHEKGIIHRDLKPANVAVTTEGLVKLLDFGLAKAFTGEAPAVDPTSSPTISEVGTREGLILGTASYMSPEQARGQVLDERADIWSFGCCLYEALAGRRAYGGDTVSDTLAAVLEREVDWGALPETTPASVRRLLRRCLHKDRRRRLRHIADARIEIEEALEAPPEAAFVRAGADGAPTSTARSWPHPWIALSAALAVTLGVVLLREASEDAAGKRVTRTTIALARPPQAPGDNFSVAISPDGTTIAYTDGALHLRELDELAPRPIAGTAPALSPFFSPDGRWVGFVSWSSGQKVPITGGAPVVMWPRGGGGNGGASWSTSGTIVFGGRGTWGGLMELRDGEEAPRMLTRPDFARGHFIHRWPRVLPGDDVVLLTIGRSDMETWDDASIAVLRRDTREMQIVLEGGSQATYSPTGHLIYIRGGSLLAVPFDLTDLSVRGTPVPVAHGINWEAGFGLSEDGTLVYAPGTGSPPRSRMLLVDRRGSELRVLAEGGEYNHTRFSPDGGRVAFATGGATPDIRVFDLARGTETAITSRWNNATPRWTHDERYLMFSSLRSGWWNTHRRLADGSGEIEHLLATPDHISSYVGEAAGVALWEETPGPDIGSGSDLILRSADTGALLRPFLATPAFEWQSELSQNGQWVAYASDESGRFEVYFRPFPEGTGQWLVSTSGGQHPRWSRGGREIVYIDGDRVMAVDVRLEQGSARLGRPRQLFEHPIARMYGTPGYDVTPDGESFVLVEPGEAALRPDHLVLVQNFDEELKRLLAEAGS